MKPGWRISAVLALTVLLSPSTSPASSAPHRPNLLFIKTNDNIGRILDGLDKCSLASNTAVVFASDNGYFLGEHGLGDKRAAYEESMRIPLILRYPAAVRAGMMIDHLILNLDLAPTFLELGGVDAPNTMQGRSWLPLLAGQTRDWRASFLFEYFFEANLPATPAMAAVRTPAAKLILYPGHDTWTELFDLKSDPFELHNLANDPGHPGLLREFHSELVKLKSATTPTAGSHSF